MVYDDLDKLERVSAQIIRKFNELKQENKDLKRELLETKKQVREKEEALEHFQNQIKISKLVNKIPVENKESAELRDRINDYIKEIDKIITYMSE